MKKIFNLTKQNGYIAFTSLLVISAITTVILISSVLISVTTSKNSLSFKKSQEAEVAANGCLENALLRLKFDNNYNNETLTVSQTTCTISISGVGANKTVNIEAVINDPPSYYQAIQASVKVKGNGISLTSYQKTF